MSQASQNVFSVMDLSGGQQNTTSHLIRKRIEVFDSKNAAYHSKIGSASRRPGYELVGRTIQYGNDSLYGGVYLYGNNNKIIVGINDITNSNATLQYLDSDNYWKTILSNATVNTRFQCLNYLDEFYVAGRSPSDYMTLTNIDSTLVPSTTRNVYGAPKSRFIAEYNGKLYAINCSVNGVRYADRAYISSSPTGAITFVQTDQIGPQVGLRVDSVRYLKAGMGIDIYGAGTNQLKVSNLVITSVDKNNNRIGFAQTTINVSDNDEIWLTGRKGKLSILWNTDYPTPETADWLRIPPGEDETAAFTGHTVNNNRLFLFSKNSTWKWDGQNLIKVSPVIGCVSHETIRNIGSWTLWLHTTGVWGYNDNTGQLKLLSKAITPTFLRVNPSNYQYTSAVVQNRIYKLSLGQLMGAGSDTVLATTSTSTSSTSTSSTSSSTSSTSTSSTSTSSTVSTTTSTSSTSSSTSSTSVSTSSTSTSSTSSSTSSTSTSSTSSSSSTSTSSTSTTTTPTGKTVTRVCYDFDLNIWWTEEHNREIRFQFLHEMNGYRKPYFTDENGYLFRDETGFTDFGNPIPMQVEIGRTNCGTEQGKNFLAVQVDSENARTGTLQYAIDGGDWLTLGQISDPIQSMAFPQLPKQVSGRDINFRFVHNDYGDPPIFNGLIVYFSIVEALVNELGERL